MDNFKMSGERVNSFHYGTEYATEHTTGKSVTPLITYDFSLVIYLYVILINLTFCIWIYCLICERRNVHEHHRKLDASSWWRVSKRQSEVCWQYSWSSGPPGQLGYDPRWNWAVTAVSGASAHAALRKCFWKLLYQTEPFYFYFPLADWALVGFDSMV